MTLEKHIHDTAETTKTSKTKFLWLSTIKRYFSLIYLLNVNRVF